MSKISPKKMVILTHKLAVLATLMIENLDELQFNTPQAKEIHDSAGSFLKVLEKFSEEVFTPEASSPIVTVYIADLAHKVDTVIRKEHQEIHKLEKMLEDEKG